MATIKAYTDLDQSKKLAEILPLESADMAYYFMKDSGKLVNPSPFVLDGTEVREDGMFTYLDCWSLAALLGALPILDNRSPVMSKTFDGKYRVIYHSTAYEKAKYTEDFDNPVDACYGMIMRLNELKML